VSKISFNFGESDNGISGERERAVGSAFDSPDDDVMIEAGMGMGVSTKRKAPQ